MWLTDFCPDKCPKLWLMSDLLSPRFIASGPDQRRSESIGPDGITRGSYSYLDDKGVQRTVQYIAGAGIGYRVVQTTTGAGTHNLLRPAAPQFGVFSQQSNDLPAESLYFDDTPNRGFPKDSGRSPDGDDVGEKTPPILRDVKKQTYDENDVSGFPVRKRPTTTRKDPWSGSRRPINSYDRTDPNEIIPDIVRPQGRYPPTPTPPSPPQTHRRPPTRHNADFRPTAPPPTSYPEYFGVNSLDFDKANIRAHVQNIDLLPSPRYPSPGDALKWDLISGN